MTRFLLDSGIASDYIDRRNGVYDRARTEIQKGNRVGTAVPVLAELVAGISGAGAATATSRPCGSPWTH